MVTPSCRNAQIFLPHPHPPPEGEGNHYALRVIPPCEREGTHYTFLPLQGGGQEGDGGWTC